jgi:hypothetical protein
MKVIFCILEIEEEKVPTCTEISDFFSVDLSLVKVKKLSKCTAGYEKRLAIIADLYLWTCKYWYGLFQEKLTYIEIRTASELNLFFQIKYAEHLRLAIASETLKIFDQNEMILLKEANWECFSNFNKKREKAIKPFVKKLERCYRLLYLYNK